MIVRTIIAFDVLCVCGPKTYRMASDKMVVKWKKRRSDKAVSLHARRPVSSALKITGGAISDSL